MGSLLSHNRSPHKHYQHDVSSNFSMEIRQRRQEKLYKLMGEYIGHDKTSIQKQIVTHIEYTLAKSRFDFTIEHCCQAVKLSLFDRLIECGNDSNQHFSINDCKRAYILSDQGLSATNKSLKSILVNMNLEIAYRESLEELGYDLNEIYDLDDQIRNHYVKNSVANGQDSKSTYNNNLTDLAESLVDSLATLELPAWGYGLRYKFGNIKQYRRSLQNPVPKLSRGVSQPKLQEPSSGLPLKKLTFRNSLEIQRFDFTIQVFFEGRVEKQEHSTNGLRVVRSRWVDQKRIKAMAYDSQNAGYNTFNTVSVRLWSALPIFN
mmetsp:Transcript_10057/g.16945  ORF Transcript_10057/g.16945 Transcript_10057/m.16945 type:complete len:319 (-) Transcript_10057:2364-3320(-)